MDVEHNGLLRRTLRHVQAVARPECPVAVDAGRTSFPDDWFDLGDRLWADLGAMGYLLSLTGYHRKLPVSDIMALLEPPLRLRQYKIFRSTDGHPRAFMTWAGLTPAAEYDFAIRHKPLHPQDWNGGASKWLVNLAAPFGHLEQIIPMLTANPRETQVRTLWHNKTGARYRVLQWSRPPGQAAVQVNSFNVAQFARLLLAEPAAA